MALLDTRVKQSVQVLTRYGTDGSVDIVQVALPDGRVFPVTRTEVPLPTARQDRSQPQEYRVEIRGHMTSVFAKDGRWWVLMKQP